MLNRIRTKRTVVLLIAVAVIASACGNDTGDGVRADEGAAPVDADAAEADFFEALERISDENEVVIQEAFDAVFADSEGRAFETLLPGFADALATVVSLQEDAIAQYEALDPPERFALDHERGIQLLKDQNEAFARQQAAAIAGDTELIAQIDLEIESLLRQGLSDISAEFRDRLPLDDEDAAFGDLFGDLEADEVDYLDAVSLGWDEFARRNRAFGTALQQSYSSDELLLLALLDAGAGEAFAAVQEVIVELDPPESYAEGHERLLQHLEELVALDSVIATAAENGDVVGFEVANYGLAISGARYSLEAPPALVAVNGDPTNLIPPSDLPGETFGAELWQALRRFDALALRTQIESGVFPAVSEEKLAEAMAQVMPTVIGFTEDVIADVGALEPPADLAVGHDRLVTYLEDLLELRQSVSDAASAGDLETLRKYGELGGFAADRAESELWCTAGADLTDDPIQSITDVLFRGSDEDGEARLCASD